MIRWLTISALLSLAPAAMAQQFDGVLEWARVATLSSPLNGKISSVKVEEGDAVKKGDLLATLDPRIYQANVKRAKAVLKGLSSRAEETEREWVRAQDLYDRTVLSTTDLQDVEVRFAEAQADKGEAEAQLSLAKVQLEYTQLRAPFDGIVTQRHINPYETVSNKLQAMPMIQVAGTESFKSTFWVTPQAAASLNKGDSIQVNIEGQAHNGTISHVGLNSKMEHQQVLTSVLVMIPQNEGKLHAGRPAHINLP